MQRTGKVHTYNGGGWGGSEAKSGVREDPWGVLSGPMIRILPEKSMFFHWFRTRSALPRVTSVFGLERDTPDLLCSSPFGYPENLLNFLQGRCLVSFTFVFPAAGVQWIHTEATQ